MNAPLAREPVPAEERKPMSLRRKLAACLAHMWHPETGGPLVPGADRMTDEQIIAAVEFDHELALAIGGKDHASNIRPVPVAWHRGVKTPLDAKLIAKMRRRRKAQESFDRDALSRPCGQKRQPKNSIRSRNDLRRNARP